ncbi:Low-affinity potassium transport protein [Golovinomyces cichoracearum]|uniref:Potassium transport protein n=1 Tax=Golovinomyces cichoracearum TaxID=62708 RepID=A0A420HM51_9PEZI|nr:Low-affinity potassium transport protein [Golovinomyces cichoracearum]
MDLISKLVKCLSGSRISLILKNLNFSFITMHYILIIGAAVIGSICIFSAGNVAYIDALIMATGAATQAGLNTVDLNRLNTWQQVVLYIVPMMMNPISINTSVVFLRLWWFEKKFQHVVQEARRKRPSIMMSLSRSKTFGLDGKEEQGLNGREIPVVRAVSPRSKLTPIPTIITENIDENGTNEIQQLRVWNKFATSEEIGDGEPDSLMNETAQRQIKFADQVNLSGDIAHINRYLVPRSKEDHIAFLQRQRDAEDGEVLRIPGPRDAEAGIGPHSIYNTPGTTSVRKSTNHVEFHPPRRNSTFPKSARDLSMVSDPEISNENFNSIKNSPGNNLKLDPPNQRRKSIQTIKSVLTRDKDETAPYLSWQPTIGHNSAFLGLTEEQREELGGIEYRSLKTLAVVLVSYFWGFSFLGFICLVPWILNNKAHSEIVESIGQGRVWWSLFTANSAFTDLGFTLTPDSMIQFQQASWPLVILSYLITAGNTAFPIILRVIIWIGALFSPSGSGLEQELRFLLDHPRRCFTLLFPTKATLWLALVLIILNVVDVTFSIILDLGNEIVTHLPTRYRILDGFFQAVSTRTAGFTIVDLSQLHPAVQVSFLIMMYISIFPIAISVRHTNVYEDRSLGIYDLSSVEIDDKSNFSYIATHLRHQLSFDLWYIFLGLFVISISEGSRLKSGDSRFTLFTVLFEIVSAYGTVGLSLGYKDINSSFTTEFGVIAKVVIIAMQIRGRHRGLPNELDKAVILPGEAFQQKAEEDSARIAQRRRASNAAEIANGLRKTSSKGQAAGLFSAVFYPGPPLPRSYRKYTRDDRPSLESRSSATTSGRDTALGPERDEYNFKRSDGRDYQN